MAESAIVKAGSIDLTRPLSNAADWEDLLKKQFGEWEKVIPKACGMDPVKLARLAFTFFRKNRNIVARCTAGSVLGALMNAAELGYEIGSKRGHATIVSFGSEATLMPMYRGLCMTAYRSGAVLAIDAAVVYENEHFVNERGLVPKLEHIPDFEEQPISAATHAYAIGRIRGLPAELSPNVVVPKAYWERIAEAAIDKVGKTKTLWGHKIQKREMIRKTPVRYLWKLLPDDTMPDLLQELWAKEDRYQGTAEISAEALTSKATAEIVGDLEGVTGGDADDGWGRDVPESDEDFSDAGELFA